MKRLIVLGLLKQQWYKVQQNTYQRTLQNNHKTFTSLILVQNS